MTNSKNRPLIMVPASFILTLGLVISVHAQRLPNPRSGKLKDYCVLFERSNDSTRSIVTSVFLYVPALGSQRVDGDIDSFLFSENCNNPDYFALVGLTAKQQMELLKRSERKEENHETIYQIKVRGHIQVSDVPRYGEQGWLRAQFKIDKLVAAKKIEAKVPRPDVTAQAPISSAGSVVKTINSTLLALVLNGDLQGLSMLLGKSAVPLIKFDNQNMDLSSLIGKVSWSTKAGSVVSSRSFKRTGEEWRLCGVVSTKPDSMDIRSYRFQTVYAYRNMEEWQLKELFLFAVNKLSQSPAKTRC